MQFHAADIKLKFLNNVTMSYDMPQSNKTIIMITYSSYTTMTVSDLIGYPFFIHCLKVPVPKSLENEFSLTGRYGHFSNQYLIQVVKNCKFVSRVEAITKTIMPIPL